MTILENNELLLQCTGGSANPPGVYQWMRNNVNIVGANSMNFSKLAGRSDEGNYTCRITNALGSVHSDVRELKVPCKFVNMNY